MAVQGRRRVSLAAPQRPIHAAENTSKRAASVAQGCSSAAQALANAAQPTQRAVQTSCNMGVTMGRLQSAALQVALAATASMVLRAAGKEKRALLARRG